MALLKGTAIATTITILPVTEAIPNQVKYMDLKGWEAYSAYDVLHQRGFREVERYKKDRLWIVWEHSIQPANALRPVRTEARSEKFEESEKCY